MPRGITNDPLKTCAILFAATFLTTAQPIDESLAASDVLIMHAVRESFAMPPKSGWLYDGDENDVCSWIGVDCSSMGASQHVNLIDLASKGVAGTISPLLFNLSHLEILRLDDNMISGWLPGSLWEANNLKVVSLHSNSLSGSIPEPLAHTSSVSQLNLRTLRLGGNYFSGTVPSSLCSAPNLSILTLHTNRGLCGLFPCKSDSILYQPRFDGTMLSKESCSVPTVDVKCPNLTSGTAMENDLTSCSALRFAAGNGGDNVCCIRTPNVFSVDAVFNFTFRLPFDDVDVAQNWSWALRWSFIDATATEESGRGAKVFGDWNISSPISKLATSAPSNSRHEYWQSPVTVVVAMDVLRISLQPDVPYHIRVSATGSVGGIILKRARLESGAVVASDGRPPQPGKVFGNYECPNYGNNDGFSSPTNKLHVCWTPWKQNGPWMVVGYRYRIAVHQDNGRGVVLERTTAWSLKPSNVTQASILPLEMGLLLQSSMVYVFEVEGFDELGHASSHRSLPFTFNADRIDAYSCPGETSTSQDSGADDFGQLQAILKLVGYAFLAIFLLGTILVRPWSSFRLSVREQQLALLREREKNLGAIINIVCTPTCRPTTTKVPSRSVAARDQGSNVQVKGLGPSSLPGASSSKLTTVKRPENLEWGQVDVWAEASDLVFVFTDIEASTKMAAYDGRAYKIAQTIHDNIIRTAMEELGGYEINTQGDAFELAFQAVPQAVRFCINVQQRLLGTNWPPVVMRLPTCALEIDTNGLPAFRGPRVRMGIHWAPKGRFTARTHDHSKHTVFGGEAFSVAREIGDCGYGGQILLTETTLSRLHAEPQGLRKAGYPLIEHVGKFVLNDINPRIALDKVSVPVKVDLYQVHQPFFSTALRRKFPPNLDGCTRTSPSRGLNLIAPPELSAHLTVVALRVEGDNSKNRLSDKLSSVLTETILAVSQLFYGHVTIPRHLETENRIYVLFPSPRLALQFCVVAQVALLYAPWSETGRIYGTQQGEASEELSMMGVGKFVFRGPRVAMAVHTGELCNFKAEHASRARLATMMPMSRRRTLLRRPSFIGRGARVGFIQRKGQQEGQQTLAGHQQSARSGLVVNQDALTSIKDHNMLSSGSTPSDIDNDESSDTGSAASLARRRRFSKSSVDLEDLAEDMFGPMLYFVAKQLEPGRWIGELDRGAITFDGAGADDGYELSRKENTEANDFSGALLQTASLLCGVTQGGQCIMSSKAWQACKSNIPPQIRVLHLGTHSIMSSHNHSNVVCDLFEASPLMLSERDFATTPSTAMLSPGFREAPSVKDDLTIVCCRCDVSKVASLHHSVVFRAVDVWSKLCRKIAADHKGYECYGGDRNGEFTLAFAYPKDALTFCCLAQVALLKAAWSSHVLRFYPESGSPSLPTKEVQRPNRSANSQTPILWRGLPVAMALAHGRADMKRVVPITGRAAFSGDLPRKAERILEYAAPGQVLFDGENLPMELEWGNNSARTHMAQRKKCSASEVFLKVIGRLDDDIGSRGHGVVLCEASSSQLSKREFPLKDGIKEVQFLGFTPRGRRRLRVRRRSESSRRSTVSTLDSE